VRPVSAVDVYVIAPQFLYQNLTLTAYGPVNRALAQQRITEYMSTLNPGETFYLARAVNLVIQCGATNAVITSPSADVTASALQLIRPGTITVN
ncbi:MAG: hypothetical protein GX410_01690, partial [Elusimicrobia bacterium]|nr:hypothetical protein [Elusimicrobiota bacterium]